MTDGYIARDVARDESMAARVSRWFLIVSVLVFIVTSIVQILSAKQERTIEPTHIWLIATETFGNNNVRVFKIQVGTNRRCYATESIEWQQNSTVAALGEVPCE